MQKTRQPVLTGSKWYAFGALIFALCGVLSLLLLLSWEQPWISLNRVSVTLSLSHVQLFAIPWTVAHQAPLSMEFSRQEYWSGLPFSPPGDLPNPGIFSTQGPNPFLLHFYRWILYHCTTQVFFTFCIFFLAIVDLHITESGGLELEQNWSPRLMNNILGLLWNTFNDFWLAIHRPFWGFVGFFCFCFCFFFLHFLCCLSSWKCTVLTQGLIYDEFI